MRSNNRDKDNYRIWALNIEKFGSYQSILPQTEVWKRMKREESALGSVGDEAGDLLLDDKGRDDGVGGQTNEQNE